MSTPTCELLGLERERREDHVAAVAAADDPDAVGVDVRARLCRYFLAATQSHSGSRPCLWSSAVLNVLP